MAHRSHDRLQQLAHSHHPTIQSRSGQINASLPLQNRTLPIERQVIGILADHRIDDDPITSQTFLDDPNRCRCTCNALFFTPFAGALFALGHHHEVFGRLHIELLARLVADHSGFFSALSANTLLRGAGDDLFDARQVRGQFLTARMLARVLEW